MSTIGSDLLKSTASLTEGPLHSPATNAKWCALYATCRHEKRVAEHLAVRGIEHFLPLYQCKSKWRDGSKVTLHLPLFPCYVFVQLERLEKRRVLEIPGALAIVGGTGGAVAAVQQSVIDALRAGLQEGRVTPHPVTAIGQKVRICHGTFAGMDGIVARKKNGLRVVLTLALIMQSISVEVSETELEPLSSSIFVPRSAA